MSVDIPRKRVGLSMRLDDEPEQPEAPGSTASAAPRKPTRSRRQGGQRQGNQQSEPLLRWVRLGLR